LGRERPNDRDYWDGNWLVVDVLTKVGGFTGHAVANLRAEELQRFREALEAVYDAVSGTATFDTMEGWLSLTVTCEHTGKVTIVGEMTDRPGVGDRLHFSLPDIDQTFLPPLIEQLRSCEEAYSVVGSPGH
jgi:hypothetical protein